MKNDDSYSKLNALQKAIVWSLFIVAFLVVDIFISMVLTFPFSLLTKVWTYWFYVFIMLVVTQLILTVIIVVHGNKNGGNK